MSLFSSNFDPEFLGRDLNLVNGALAVGESNDFAMVEYEENVKQALIRRLSPETSGQTFVVEDVEGLKVIPAPTSKSLGPILSEPLTVSLPLRTKGLVQEILEEEDRIDVINVLCSISELENRPGIIIQIFYTIRATEGGGSLGLFSIPGTGQFEVL